MAVQVGTLGVSLSKMFGGKTSYLLHILDVNFQDPNLYINSVKDVRSTLPFSTHAHYLIPKGDYVFDADYGGFVFKTGNTIMIKTDKLEEIPLEFVLKFKNICIDEAQFLPDLPEKVMEYVEKYGKNVYVAALSGNSRRHLFGRTHELLPLSDYFELMGDSFCAECRKNNKQTKALFTHRIIDIEGAEIQIGSAEYAPVCRACYLQLNPNAKYGFEKSTMDAANAIPF